MYTTFSYFHDKYSTYQWKVQQSHVDQSLEIHFRWHMFVLDSDWLKLYLLPNQENISPSCELCPSTWFQKE